MQSFLYRNQEIPTAHPWTWVYSKAPLETQGPALGRQDLLALGVQEGGET